MLSNLIDAMFRGYSSIFVKKEHRMVQQFELADGVLIESCKMLTDFKFLFTSQFDIIIKNKNPIHSNCTTLVLQVFSIYRTELKRRGTGWRTCHKQRR